MAIEDAMESMLELAKEGKIKYIGLSEVGGETLLRASDVLGDKLIAVQSEYSIINHLTAEMVLPTCRKLEIAFVAFCPLARGLLSGKIKDSKQFIGRAEFDFRSISPQFREGALQNNLRLVEALEKIAKQKKCTASQLALAWLLAQGEDIIPIPGTKRGDYLQENIASLNIDLTDADLASIDKIMKEYPVQGYRLPEEIMNLNWHV